MSSRITVWGAPPHGIYARRGVAELPFPLEEPTCRIFARARHALWAAVRAVGLGPGDEVLVPAYHHGSEVEALVRAGLTCRFFDVGPALEPDADELDALVGAHTRALLVVHALGRPQDATRWRRWCDDHDLLMLEDGAQAWLGQSGGLPLGSSGDVAIFCLYKTLPLPDGAAVVCANPPTPTAADGSGASRLLRHEVVTTMQESARLTRFARRVRGVGEYSPLDDFALGDPTAAPSAATDFLLRRLAHGEVRDQRCANYRWLAERLAPWMQPPFDVLPAGASPMVLPITVPPADKADVLERLARHEIDALDFWSVPHPSLPAGRFPRAATLRSSIIGLPVHQGLSTRDRDRLVTALAA
jgi:dTDP-4-amino-4,6-dideoxygalactose transaminase